LKPSLGHFAQVRLLVSLALAASLVSPAAGGTVTLIPAADTTIMAFAPDNNAGGRPWISAGSNRFSSPNRALLRFGIATNVPAGARITAATLSLSVTGIPIDGYAVGVFDLHRLLRDWGEGNKNPINSPGQGLPAGTNEADWNTPFAYTTNVWGQPGAAEGSDYAAAVTASQYFYDTTQSPYPFPGPSDDDNPMIRDIQLWLDQPGTNFGWILLCENEGDPLTARRLGSREDPNFPPQLTIDYLLPPHIDQIQHVGNAVSLSFTAQADQTYAVQFRDSLPPGPWQLLTNVGSFSAVTPVSITDAIASSRRFYRLMTY
jgi:hypothetical protein